MLSKRIKGTRHVEKLWCSTERASRIASIALFLTVLAGTAFSDSYRPWTGEFLRVGAGARGMGMGNAYTAVEGDIFSYYYNPAGLSTMSDRQFAISFRYLTMDRYFKDVVFGSKIGPGAAFALSWINAGTHDIIGRDLNGKPTGSLSDTRNSFGVTFSKYLNKMISIGLTAKISLWKLDRDDAKAFGIDAGVNVRPFNHLTTSFVARDLNSRFTWNSSEWMERLGEIDGQPMQKEDKFPLYYTAGVAYKAYRDRILVASTFEFIEDNPFSVNLGASFRVNDTFTVRTGLYNYTTSGDLNNDAFTAGFTVRVSGSVGFDYAYSAGGMENDSIHGVSLIMNYGVE